MAKKLEENDQAKKYGNAFLGPNLWNKNELFQSEKFGVKLEYLDVQEFLAENEMDRLDSFDFLSELEKIENCGTNQNANILSPPPKHQPQQSQACSDLGLLMDSKRPNFNFISSNDNELQGTR